MNTGMSNRRPRCWLDKDDSGPKIGFSFIFINLFAVFIYGLNHTIPFWWVMTTAVGTLGFPLAATILTAIWCIILDKIYEKKYKKYIEKRNFMNWVKGCRK